MSKNFSNTTSATTTTSAPDIVLINMDIATKVFNIFCLAVHVAYFILVILSRDLRTRALLFINHAVLTNLFYPVAVFVFLWLDPNTMPNKEQVRLLCSFFEIFWSFTIYARMYSILLIAVYRYFAVFKPDLFKRMNSSIPLLILPIVLLWLVSIALPFIFKYVFSTTYSVTNCLAGFSTIWLNSLLQALFYIAFSLIFPTIAIISIYIIIARKLKEVGKNAKKTSRATTRIKISTMADTDNTSFSVSGSSKAVIISKKRELKFANQFILMCLLVVLTICGIGIFSLRGVIPNYFNLFYYWRPIIRCWILFFSSLLPIFSVYFNPSRRKIVNFFRSPTRNSASIGDIKY